MTEAYERAAREGRLTAYLRDAIHVATTRRWRRSGGQAACQCGWEGKNRRSRSTSVEDARLHLQDMMALGAKVRK